MRMMTARFPELGRRIAGLALGAMAALALTARYEWGNTGFGFELPVYYRTGGVSATRAPEFFGIRKEADLVVLNALLTFLPDRQLADAADLIVFPSNAALAERAHGMAESTLRRHLAALIAAAALAADVADQRDRRRGGRRRDHGDRRRRGKSAGAHPGLHRQEP
mgnify:CR=1 FL=1